MNFKVFAAMEGLEWALQSECNVLKKGVNIEIFKNFSSRNFQ